MTIKEHVESVITKKKKRNRIIKVLGLCGLLVAAGVSLNLMMPGIAMTDDAVCGIVEHTHSAECQSRTLVCGLEETPGHTHDESCIQTERVLICGLEESEDHVHTDECYEERQTYICGLEESEGHTHSDACYEEILCDQEEHVHDDSCYAKPETEQATESVSESEAAESETVTDETGTETETESETEESEEIVLSYLVEEDGIEIQLHAKPGVLPEDAVLQVEKVSVEKEEAIREAIQKQIDENSPAVISEEDTEITTTEVEKTYTYDINIYSESAGGFVQPKDGTVEVRFLNIAEGNKDDTQLNVYHVEMDDQHVVENLEEMTDPVKENTTEISFDAEHFSYYAVSVEVANTSQGIVITGDVPEEFSGKYRVKLRFIKYDNGWKERGTEQLNEILVSGTPIAVKVNSEPDYQYIEAILVDDHGDAVVSDGYFVKDSALYYMDMVKGTSGNKKVSFSIEKVSDSLSTMESSQILSEFGFSINFGIFADTFSMANHAESNVAINLLTGAASGGIGNSDNVRQYSEIVIQVTKTVEPKPAQPETFRFVLCDGNGNQKGNPISITVGTDGVGTGSFPAFSFKNGEYYQVYELNAANQRVPYVDGTNGEYKVTYTNGSTGTLYAPGGDTNWIKHAESTYTGYSNNGDYLFTTDSGNPTGFDSSRVIHMTEDEFEANMPINSMLNGQLSELSRKLFALQSSQGIDVYHVSGKDLATNKNMVLNYNEGNMAVINVIVPDNQKEIDFTSGDFMTLKNSSGTEYMVLGNRMNQKWASPMASRLIWNFVNEDGSPYKGTVQFGAGAGMFLCPQGTLSWSTTSPLSMIAKTVIQVSGEIHKVPFGDPTEIKRYVGVKNKKGGDVEPETTELVLKKKWNTNSGAVSLPEKITVKLMQIKYLSDGTFAGIKEQGSYDITRASNWELSVKNLPKKDADGSTYKYYVKEISVDGFSTSYGGVSSKNPVDQGSIEITNTSVGNSEEPSVTSLKLEKLWQNQASIELSDSLLPDEVKVQIYQVKEEITPVTIQLNGAGESSQSLAFPVGTKLVLSGKPVGGATPGVTYGSSQYALGQEIVIKEGSSQTITVTGASEVSFNATYPVMSVMAEQTESSGGGDSSSKGVLYSSEPISLNRDNEWKYEDNALPSVIKENNKFYHCTYYVEEVNGEQFKVTYNAVEETGIVTITNTIETYELPQAGGIGTTPFKVIGILLMSITICNLIYCYKKKRREAR